MIQFLKDSIRELKHVVWPTRKETTLYFSLVVILLICFGIYLFIFSTLFSEFIFSLKGMVSSPSQTPIIDTSSIDLGGIDVDAGTVDITTTDAPVVEPSTTEELPVENSEVPTE